MDAFTCHDIFQCNPKLSCCAPVEAYCNASKRPLMAVVGFIRDINNLYAICAGKSNDAESGKIDPDLKTVYANVLSICDTHVQELRRKVISQSLH